MEDGSLWTIVATAALTTAGTFIVAYAAHFWSTSKEERERERYANYLAIRVVTLLDPFVSGCAEVVADVGSPDQEGYRTPDTTPPTLTLPDDVDWKNIRPEFMYRILGLPNEISTARQSIAFIAENVSGPPDFDEVFEERTYQYGKLGLKALDLATEIRKAYGIPELKYGTSDWNPRKYFDLAVKERDEMQAIGAQLTEKLLKAHAAKQARLNRI